VIFDQQPAGDKMSPSSPASPGMSEMIRVSRLPLTQQRFITGLKISRFTAVFSVAQISDW
jgi:hypothetical protein